MKKICFYYVDQPKHLCLKLREPICFPFYVSDPVYDVNVDAHGIMLYLIDGTAQISKHIQLESIKGAMALLDGSVTLLGNSVIVPDGIGMQIGASDVLFCGKKIEIERLSSGMSIAGLYDERPVTLGELDPCLFSELDPMPISFRKFGSIPAYLDKRINITQKSALGGSPLVPRYDFA